MTEGNNPRRFSPMPVSVWFLLSPFILFVLLGFAYGTIHVVTLPFHPKLDLSKNAFFDHPAIESFSSAFLAPFASVLFWSLFAPFFRIGAAILLSSFCLTASYLFSQIDFEPPPEEVIPYLDGLSVLGCLLAIAAIIYIDRKSLKTLRI